MTELLALLGIGTASAVFTPILLDIAKQVTVEISSSYIAKAFEGAFSVINKKTLTKATGRALKELLDLIENELLDNDYDEDKLRSLLPHVKLFIEHDAIQGCLKPLFIDPDYHLDPKVFASAWETLDVPTLPADFSWQRIAKRFSRKVTAIRNDDNDELKETFDILKNNRNADALQELAGLPPEFDLDTYREALVERFGNINFDSIDTSGANYNGIRLWSVFVAQSARLCHSYQPQLLELPKEHQNRLLDQGDIEKTDLESLQKFQEQQRQAYFDEPLRSVLDICDDPEFPAIVILGDPGSGKSTLLHYLALQWARNEDIKQRYSAPLPILIELRDYNLWQCNQGKSFVSYLHHASNWHRLNQQTLDYLLKQPERVVLLLDGLDEVFDPSEREQVINDIHRFSNDYKNTRIIVTSRIIGYKAQRLRDANFKDFMLQDLDSEQIEAFLQLWHKITFSDPQDAENKRERLDKAIKASQSIQMLAGNPLLTMMAIINRHQELPRDRVSLYESAAKVLLQQWDTERGLKDFPEISKEIDLQAKTAILRKIAYHMQAEKEDGKTANIIQSDTLIKIIDSYLQEELGFTQTRQASNALVKQLRGRNFILCFLGADSYAFVHRTFLEYFCASDLVERFHKEKSLSIKELISIFDKHYPDDDWHEVLRLICGQIDEQFVDKIIEHLATKTDISKWDGKSLPELPLAIWCLGEVRTPAKLLNAGTILLEQVCGLFEHLSFNSDFFKKIIKAANNIGINWPSKKKINEYTGNSSLISLVKTYWPKLVVAINKNKYQQITFLQKSPIEQIRYGAVDTLVNHWPDKETRSLLVECAMKDEGHTQNVVFQALAKHWPDKKTRDFLTERSVQAKDQQPRTTALEALAKYWPDKETRKLLTARAVQDKDQQPRTVAVKALAKHWPDKETRELLTARVLQDKDQQPRTTALEALAKYWPDKETHKLLTARAV